MRVAVVGCGDVAQHYGRQLVRRVDLALQGAFDRNPERAAAFVARYGGLAYDRLDALLDDPAVDVVVNLVRQRGHFEVSSRALRAGKHTYSEKPLAMTYDDARALLELAERHDVRLASAPVPFLGEAQRTVWRLVRGGRIGRVRVIYAEANWGRIERWHPRPIEFYEAGATVDVGVYPLTLLTAMFGPARRVWARAADLLGERVTVSGERFAPRAPDWTVAIVELADGPLVRLTTSFYVERSSRQDGVELHGDRGALHLESWHDFDAGVALSLDGGPYEPVTVEPAPVATVDYSRGVAELAAAIVDGRARHGSGEHAAHVVEVVAAIHGSARAGAAIEVGSTFARPTEPNL